MKNTITIDGVTIELTEEQVEKLKVELGVKKKSPFERVGVYEHYYLIGCDSKVRQTVEGNLRSDNDLHNTANYC